jgi:TonB family protein
MNLSVIFWISIVSFFPSLSAQASDASEIGKWWKDSEIVNQLRLAESQVRQIEQRFLDYRPALADLVSEFKNRESELGALMKADPIDETKVRNLTRIVAVLRSELEKANSLMMIAFRKELTRKQWDILQKIRETGKSSAPAELAGAPRTTITPSGEQVCLIGGPVKAPRLRSRQLLSPYTPAATAAGIQGYVLLQAVIRKDGRVTDLLVLRGLGYGLDESAIETVGRWKFEPSMLNGQPVNVQTNIEVSFRRPSY